MSCDANKPPRDPMRSGPPASPTCPTPGLALPRRGDRLYSRRVIGWAMDEQRTTTLTGMTLEMALCQWPVLARPLHHSDRGSQYGAVAYQHRLVSRSIRCSMSRPGNCWDHAVVESFFATLKTELIRGRSYYTRQAARTAIFE